MKTWRKLLKRNWKLTKDIFHDLSLSRTGPMIFLASLNSLLPTSKRISLVLRKNTRQKSLDLLKACMGINCL